MSTDEGVRAAPSDDTPDLPGVDAPLTPPRRRGGARRRSRRASDAPVAVAAVAEAGGPRRRRFLDRSHPVFTPLAGFFTGVLLVVVTLGLLGAILDLVVGYDVGKHPWVFLLALGVLLALNLALVLRGGTRRFARYMLFGILTTPAVVVAVASVTFWLLLRSD